MPSARLATCSDRVTRPARTPAPLAAGLLVFAGLLIGTASAQAQTPGPTAPPRPAAVSTPETAFFHDNTGTLASPPFATLAEFGTAAGGVSNGKNPEAFWQSVLSAKQMPLIFGNTAVFLYRGKASTVDWRGDFTKWNTLGALRGRRLGTSDIWVATKTFPRDARLDYKVQVDSNRQILDPLNPFTQLGGYGRNSVLRMPAYVYPQSTLPRKGIARGEISKPQVLGSRHLGYAVRYWVYTPPGHAALKELPVIYATDGQEYVHADMGALPVVIDNLISDGEIRPVMAVFIDPRNPQTQENRRGPELLTNDRYEAFLTEELIPAIEAAYGASRKAEDRAILGDSLGGLHATWAIMKNPQVFGLAAIQSPYFKAKPRVLAQFEQTARLPVKVFVNQGTYDLDVEGTRALRDALKSKGYTYKYIETNDGHSWGNWRGLLDDMLIFFFGR